MERAYNRRLRALHRRRYGLLRDWYGPEFAETEIAAHVSHPVEFRGELERLVATLETPERTEFRRIAEHWREFCGAAVARMAAPVELTPDGVLLVEVRHSLLIAELKPAMKLVLARVNQGVASPLCREIRLVIAGG